jgi:hypothetical protein
MRYIIENTEAYRIMAERARTRELAGAAALATEQLARVARNPARRQAALMWIGAFVVAAVALRVLLPVAARVEIAAGLLALGSLAIPGFVLREILLRGQPAPRHSQP